MQVRLPLKCRERGIHSALHQRLHFRGARIDLHERFLRHRLSILQHKFVAAVRGTGRCSLEFRSRPGYSFAQASIDLGLHFARHSFHEFLRLRQFAAQLRRLFLEPLRHLLGLAAVLFHFFFPLRSDLCGRFRLRGEPQRLRAGGEQFLYFSHA